MRQIGKQYAAMLEHWTRDAAGNRIDWTMPPYYQNGILDVRLPGEERVDHETLAKRLHEYTALTKDKMRRRNDNAARSLNRRGVSNKQGDLW